jgi:hypothetical protein
MNRRGVALLLAVVVLAALGAITLSALALARTEQSAGLAALARVQARGAAEGALTLARQGWPGSSTPVIPGGETSLAGFLAPGPASGGARVRALGGPFFSLEASGVRFSVAGRELGSVRMQLLVLLGPPDSSGNIRPSPFPRGWRVLP